MKYIPILACLIASVLSLQAQEVTGIHPSYDFSDMLPTDFKPKGIGGLDFLPDGRLVLCTWGGKKIKIGEVYILDGVTGKDGATVTYKKIAEGLFEPLGVKVVAGEIYVLQKHELSKVANTGGNSAYTVSTAYGGWDFKEGAYHQFAFGLAYQNGSFYFNTGSTIPPANDLPDRGAWLKVTLGGKHERLAGGLRAANGICVGPDGEFFATDNQGEWLPTSKLIHLRSGRFYGFRGGKSPMADRSDSPPAVWIPQAEVGRSPSQPVPVYEGIFAGQLLIGDVTYGGIKRYFLEKVKAPDGSIEYQGCVFRFSMGMSCGINRLVWGPDGALYAGGIGAGTSYIAGDGSWGRNDKSYALYRLKPNKKEVFEMLAVRAKPTGFEIEFTQPVENNADSALKYQLKQWHYEATGSYGGKKKDITIPKIKSIVVSKDKRRVFLELEEMKKGYVFHIKLANLKSSSGESPWGNEAWYTLNNLGPGVSTSSLNRMQAEGHPFPGFIRRAEGGRIRIQGMGSEAAQLRILDLDGKVLGNPTPDGEGSYIFSPTSKSGIFILEWSLGSQRGVRPFAFP